MFPSVEIAAVPEGARPFLGLGQLKFRRFAAQAIGTVEAVPSKKRR